MTRVGFFLDVDRILVIADLMFVCSDRSVAIWIGVSCCWIGFY